MHPELIDFTKISNNLDEEENMTFPMGGDTDTEDYDKPRVEASDCFDFDGIISSSALVAHLCEGDECRKHTYLALVKLYARAGLHLYNMLNGTNLKLDHLKRFNKQMRFLSSYYITLLAFDPTSRLQETFQVKVDDNCFNSLDIICPIARPKPLVITKEPFIPPRDYTVVLPFYKGSLPEWPPADAFNDRKRVYVVNESELQNTDWISLYLELVICSRHRQISDGDLSKLKIVDVAIETIEEVEPPNERLNAKRAIVYITFKGLAIGRNSEHVERKAIVRRVINEREGYLSLKGDIWS